MVGAHITTLDLVGNAWAAPVEWKVTVDSQWDENYGAENVVSKDGVWHSSAGPAGELVFDALTDVKLAGFRYRSAAYWSGSAFQNYELLRSADGEIYTTVKKGTGVDNFENAWQEFTFNAEWARYWKLKLAGDYLS